MVNIAVLSCAVLVIVLDNALALNDEQIAQIRQKFVQVGNECIGEHPLTVDDLTSLKNRVFPDSENAGCFSACVFNKIGLFDDKGHLSHQTALENVRKVFENEDEIKSIEEFLTACGKVNHEEVGDAEKGCERAKLAFQCFAENYEKLGFNIEF